LASFNKFDSFVEALAEGVHDLENDVLKVMLTNTAPQAYNETRASINELSTGNGYVSGGVAASMDNSGQSGGTYTLILSDATITASGGSIGPFRYAVLYNYTATNQELIGYWDYGSSTSLSAGQSLLIDFDNVDGVLSIE
jgi:hypothetical protein